MADQQPLPWPRFLEPEVPAVDPVRYQPITAHRYQPLPRPSDGDLDRLYRNETEQLSALGGLRTWEAVELHFPVSSDPETNQTWAANSVLTPDDSGWFAVFRRSHWNNTDEKILDKFPSLRNHGFTDHDEWNVDDERIWTELSKAIELANSLLYLSAEGEWLQNALQLETTLKTLKTLPGNYIWSEIPRKDVHNRLTAQAVRDWINSDSFHKQVRWVLAPYPAGSQGKNVHGVTAWVPGYLDSLISMSVEPMLTLLDPTVSAIEKATARFAMATTMIHELTHAMIATLRRQLPAPNPAVSPCLYLEPFYGDKEDIAECGHSFVNWTLGGDSRKMIELCSLGEWPEGSKIGPYWMAYGAPWLEYFAGQFKSNSKPEGTPWRGDSLNGVQSNAIYPIPSGWVCRLQHKDFWTFDVAKFGHKAIHHPRILVGQQVKYSSPVVYSFSRPVRFDRKAIECQASPMSDILKTAISKISIKRGEWRSMRPWQPDTRLRWSATPWGHVKGRDCLSKLTDSVFTLPRSAEKEHDATINLNQSGLKAYQHLKTETKHYDLNTWEFDVRIASRTRDVELRCLKAWFYVGIYHFVEACLPGREKIIECQGKELRSDPVWTGSTSWAGDSRHPNTWRLHTYHDFMAKTRENRHSAAFQLPRRHNDESGTLNQEHLSRSFNLARGRTLINDFYLLSRSAPVGLKSVVNSEYTKLMAQVCNRCLAWLHYIDGYLDFSLKLPSYVDEYHQNNYTVFADYVASLIKKHGKPRISLPDEDPVEMWTALPVNDGFDQSPSAKLVMRQTEPAYLTIAELYDLRRQDKCEEFVLVLSDLDLEAYDQVVMRQTLGYSQEQLQESVERSPYGWCLNEKTANEFRARKAEAGEQWAKVMPVAKLVQWVTPEEVVLQNGKDGRRTWIMAGDQVYDVSDLELYPADDNLHKLLLSKPGGNPMLAVRLEGYAPWEVVKRLQAYRVAMLFPVGLDVAPKQIRTFTSEELGWHEFRETGMYVQIYDDVYDVSTVYLDMHPGGVDILSAYAGRDATEAFEKYHPENRKELLESIQAMRIGRVIKTYRPDEEVTAGDVRLRDRVFRGEEATAAVKDIQGTPTEEFEAALKRMADGGKDEAIVTLWNKHQDLIVGRFAAPQEALITITERQLQAFDGTTIDSCLENAAFMAVDGTVYDISTLLQFGHPTMVGVLRQYVGKTCTDEGVAKIMKTRYAFRAVARLSAYKQKDGPSWDPSRLRHDITEAGLESLKDKFPMPKETEDGKKRKFGDVGCGNEMIFRDLPPRREVPLAAPLVEGERPAKRRTGEAMSTLLDWETERLIEKIQKDFASGKMFAEWQKREMVRFGDEAREMEGYWEKIGEEKVGA